MRFYEELNDFLPSARRKIRFIHEFQRRASIKDMIEALGVPHTEVDLILVNGQSVDFNHIVRDGDHISVYPTFESFDIQPLVRVRPRPLRVSRFALDVIWASWRVICGCSASTRCIATTTKTPNWRAWPAPNGGFC